MFAATFAVAPGGNIEMLDDDPLLALQTVARHRFVEDGGTSWLVRDWGGRGRQRIDAAEFLERVYATGSDSLPRAACPSFGHLEVTGDVVFPGCRPLPWLHCLDIDFRGSVILDDCHATDRVDFESCRILGTLLRATRDVRQEPRPAPLPGDGALRRQRPTPRAGTGSLGQP